MTRPAPSPAAVVLGPLLTYGEVAAAVRVHESTVRRWVADGELRALRAGHRVRFRVEDVVAFLEANATTADLSWAVEHLTSAAAKFRELCPACGKRPRQGDLCPVCAAERRREQKDREERVRANKRRWWDQHGAEAKERQRAKAKAGAP